MRRLLELNVKDLTPTPAEVLANQGMGGRANIPEKIKSLLDTALEIFGQLAEPKGLMQDLSISEFQAVYDGNGLNSSEGPVPMIVPRADALALFAATLGNAIISKSSELFAKGGPALGFMLDAVNASGAERLGRQMCLQFLDLLPEEIRAGRKLKAQYYSPGHCGWHISGQTKLFQALHPEEIGITVNANWAMKPVKSISGVLVAGDIEIHRFQPAFSFCKQCKEHKCVKRLLLLENEN
ncbi:MAG: hypothetical protein ABSC60_01935 [Acidobacteriota bacterium]|jgi:hypothetical protein